MSETGADTLRLLPLGGLGEIGLNMMALEHQGELLLIDCGLMFPEAYMLGIDLVIPDVTVLDERIGDIRGLALTHGHEDHIGAVPFLLERLGNPPIYGTALTPRPVGYRSSKNTTLKAAPACIRCSPGSGWPWEDSRSSSSRRPFHCRRGRSGDPDRGGFGGAYR
ncbi:MAG: MBL fold metallo-hydrolase [Syntrophotaleaceae bacterium]